MDGKFSIESIQVGATLTVPKEAILVFGDSGDLEGFELHGEKFGFYLAVESTTKENLSIDDMEARGFSVSRAIDDLNS